MLVDDPRVAPVVVETASVTAEVAGTHAVTTFDLVFRNPNNRQLEGTFEFPCWRGRA
jgi:S-ribosylhomocysteine lyase LuxS involved in autoinducer biosynthesis